MAKGLTWTRHGHQVYKAAGYTITGPEHNESAGLWFLVYPDYNAADVYPTLRDAKDDARHYMAQQEVQDNG